MAGAEPDPRRTLLLGIFGSALDAVNGRRRVRAALAAGADDGPVVALAVGKAAAAMMLGAQDALGTRISRGLVVAPDDGSTQAFAGQPAIRCLAGSHPLPDERSLAAGLAMLEFAAATPPGSQVLLLVSGGASALAEAPAANVALAALRELTARALAEGTEIEALNARRRELSRIKGGRLVEQFRGCQVRGLLISDVPRDDAAVAASGLLASPRCSVTVVARLADALEAAQRTARARGLDAAIAPQRLAGGAEEAARRLCHELAVIPQPLLIAGGETVVRLPARPGRGGRCQQLALAAACLIAGHPEYLLLAAGTDGRDGSSDDAGAIVDGETLSRIEDAGFDARRGLAAADSGTLLEAAGDLLYTGATGTNVGDIVLALRLPPGSATAL
jgi:hydroxypyruvate reductase